MRTITLALRTINELFEVPRFNLLDVDAPFTSGIEYIYGELKPLELRERTQVNILLPPTQISSTLQQQVKNAIERYCSFRIRQNQIELSSARWSGIKALQSGIMVLATCLLLSALVENAVLLPDFWKQFFAEGLIIIGWVSLWAPTETLLYEWWPFWRQNQLFRHMAEMEIMIQPSEQFSEQFTEQFNDRPYSQANKPEQSVGEAMVRQSEA